MVIVLVSCNSNFGQLVANADGFIIAKCENATTAESETFP